MGKWLASLGVAASLAVFSASLVVAAPQADKKKVQTAKMPNCPACKMALVAKKDKTHPTVVKVGGKTYYCCDKCPMNKPAKSTKKIFDFGPARTPSAVEAARKSASFTRLGGFLYSTPTRIRIEWTSVG